MMQANAENPDVVVVEDNEDEAVITTMALARIQPKPVVVVIPDGEQAMDRLFGSERLRPQVILLDLKLPKVHGLEILAALKEDPDTRDIPVLILSSSDHPKDIDRAQELGCTEYLCKPVDWEKYVQLVCHSTIRHMKNCTCSLES